MMWISMVFDDKIDSNDYVDHIKQDNDDAFESGSCVNFTQFHFFSGDKKLRNFSQIQNVTDFCKPGLWGKNHVSFESRLLFQK